MATVEKLGGNWVIVRYDTSSAFGESGPSPAAEDDAIRLFWTGDRWAAQYGIAKQFLAKQDAETYFTLHRDQIG